MKRMAKEMDVNLAFTLEQSSFFYGNIGDYIEKIEMPKATAKLSPLGMAGFMFQHRANGDRASCVAGEYSCFIDPFGIVYPCIFYCVPEKAMKDLRRTEYEIGKLDCKETVERCSGCWTPCETYATMMFRPWRLL